MSRVTALPKSKAKTAYGLLSEVRRLILAEPLRYRQSLYITRQAQAIIDTPVFAWPSCGTIGCVAGWVATLKSPTVLGYFEVAPYAATILNLSLEQEHWLFGADAAGHDEPQTPAHAKKGAAHIAAFQKTYAKQLKATKV